MIVGYVPYNLAPSLSQLLRREVSKAFAEVTEEKENEEQVTNYKFHMCTAFMDPKFTLTR